MRTVSLHLFNNDSTKHIHVCVLNLGCEHGSERGLVPFLVFHLGCEQGRGRGHVPCVSEPEEETPSQGGRGGRD